MRVSLEDVSFSVGQRHILRTINADFQEGVSCLLGPNGAGKTTLLRILATVLEPGAGSVRIERSGEWSIVDRARIGYVPQSFSFYSHFNTSQLVEYVARLKGVPHANVKSAVDDALRKSDLHGVAKQRLGTLSGGTLRRAAIAQSIVNDPELLILDEPTVGLDPMQRKVFLELIRSISVSRAIVLSTHIVEDAQYVADHVVVISDGSLRFMGTPSELANLSGRESPTTEQLAVGYERVLTSDSPNGH